MMRGNPTPSVHRPSARLSEAHEAGRRVALQDEHPFGLAREHSAPPAGCIP